MIYLDSSAIVKLIAPEAETAALSAWLAQPARVDLVTSKLAEVEVPRALRRSRPGVLGAAAAVLKRMYRVDMTDAVRATAAAYVEPGLRSLDAIHLSTADNLVAAGSRVSAFVTYDKRLGAVASDAGYDVVSPGVE